MGKLKSSYIIYYFIHVYSPMQIQCGRYTSSNLPAVTVMSMRGPAGMYCKLSILSMGSSQEQNWYLKLAFSLLAQRKPETLHSNLPALDSRLKYEKEIGEFIFTKILN